MEEWFRMADVVARNLVAEASAYAGNGGLVGWRGSARARLDPAGNRKAQALGSGPRRRAVGPVGLYPGPKVGVT